MLEIIENILEPIRLPGSHKLEVGNVVSISYDDNFQCVLGNSLKPFGIMVGPADKWGQILVLNSMAILRLDKYESDSFQSGDFLYCSNKGLLTKYKLHENSLMLGRVLDPPNALNLGMEISWI